MSASAGIREIQPGVGEEIMLLALICIAGTLSPVFAQRSRDEMQKRTIDFEKEWTELFVRPDALLRARLDWAMLTGIDVNKAAQVVLFAIPKDAPMERIRFEIPDAAYISVDEVAAAPGGGLAWSGACINADGQLGSYVAWTPSNRQAQSIVRTWPYVAHRLAVAPDNTIWTVGWVKDPETNDVNMKYNILKRFDTSGNVLGTFAADGRPGPNSTLSGDATSASHLRASRDRIGWLTNGMEYFEFSLDGRGRNRFIGPPVAAPSAGTHLSLALSEDNQVLVGVDEPVRGAKWSLWSLDREKRAWVPIQLIGAPHPGQGRLLGFDGPSVLVLDERWITRSFRMSKR